MMAAGAPNCLLPYTCRRVPEGERERGQGDWLFKRWMAVWQDGRGWHDVTLGREKKRKDAPHRHLALDFDSLGTDMGATQ